MVKWIIGALVAVVVMIGAFMVLDPKVSVTGGGTTVADSSASTESVSKISVEIEGAVVTPGTYTLAENLTLGDLIEKAGGLLSSADYDCFEESITLSGHDLFYIPYQSGYSEECVTTNIEKININTASAEELASINGISSSLGEAIVTYRETNGDFQSLEEIMNVTGIGTKTYEKIRDYITIKE